MGLSIDQEEVAEVIEEDLVSLPSEGLFEADLASMKSEHEAEEAPQEVISVAVTKKTRCRTSKPGRLDRKKIETVSKPEKLFDAKSIVSTRSRKTDSR